MAVITPAIGIQEGEHSAQAFRQLLSALVGQDVETFVNGISATGPGHGVVRAGHLAVTEKAGGANMSVDVAKGLALITGSSSLAQGVYAFANDATVNLTITAANPTNPRWDLVVAQVRDNDEDSLGQNDARLFVVTGTAAASPADPTVPPSCLVLARVVVPALDTAIANAQITTLSSVAVSTAITDLTADVASDITAAVAATAWGEVGYAAVTSGSVMASSATDVSGLTVTWTAVASRRYRTTVFISSIFTGSACTIYLTDSSNNIKQRANHGQTGSWPTGLSFVESGISGSVTRKVRASSTPAGDQIHADATYPAFILVEDIGPA
jgi:hypothetical protein